MNNSENLTLQQQRFCDEYLVSFNAYSAAVCAGYSMNTARKAELLHLPKIQAYLKAGMAKNAERLQVSHDMILRELAKIAFSNMGNYYDDNATLKPMCLLTTDEKAAISQYQIMDSLDQDGNRVGEFSRIKLHNKMSALDKIARHIGFYSVERVVGGELPVAGLEEVAVEMRSTEVDGAELEVGTDGELATVTGESVVSPLGNVDVGTGKILTFSPVLRDGGDGDGDRELMKDEYDIEKPPAQVVFG